MEHGATRLFEAAKYYQEKAREAEAKEEQEKNDPMKLLEKRTQLSKEEMEALSKLEELQESNRRNHKLDPLTFLDHKDEDLKLTQAQRLKKQEQEDEEEIRKLMAQKKLTVTETIEELDEDEAGSSKPTKPQWKPKPPSNGPSVLSGFIKKKSAPLIKLKDPPLVKLKDLPGSSKLVAVSNGLAGSSSRASTSKAAPPTSLLGLDYGSDSDE